MKSTPLFATNQVHPPRPKLSFLRDKRVWVMGVLNATPDSFYDSSRTESLSDAVAKAECLKNEGADLLDLGGESTRPGSTEVSPEEEWTRLLSILKTLKEKFPSLPISIDTRKAEVARRALESGAEL